MAVEGQSDKLKVFISYSRRDAVAADAIVEALQARGFELTIDRRDLPFGQKWQEELADFIRLSDTVIWLVSEASIRSEWVNWELDEVARRNKRLVPVMIGETPRDRLPRQLGEIHILPAEGLFDLMRDLAALLQVLETDRAWLKEASRLQDRATEWLAKGRPSALMLPRGALADAERWKERRPAKAPAPAQEVLDLLLASRQSASRWQRRIVTGSLALTIGAFALAGFAYMQQDRAERSEATTRKISEESQRTESGLLSEAARFISDQPNRGDTAVALPLALEGMPDVSSDDPRQRDRPPVAEIQYQLDRAYFNAPERAIIVHGGPVRAVAWSPNGRLMATGSEDKSVRFIEVATGEVVARVLHDGVVRAIAWSPDGRLLATGSEDRAARVFDAATGKEVARITHDRVVVAVSWSLSGRMLATGSGDGTARIIDAASDKEVARVRHGGVVNAVAWSPDGRLLASGSWDRTARIIEATTGRELSRVSHNGEVRALAWSPDGRRVATGSTDFGWPGDARVIEAASGKELFRVAHNGGVAAVAWSPDGRLLATGSWDNTARIIEGTTEKS
jgi:roadblock/LC7 domain-containing protein